MSRIWPAIFASAFVLFLTPAIASDAADKIVAQARKDCRSIDNGVLEVDRRAVTRADLTGNGKLDEIVDASAFSCTSSASFFCGTGGCGLTAIVNGKVFELLAKDWKIIKWHDHPILLIAVHGSACGGSNVRGCYKALVWSEGGFRSVGGK